MPKEMRICKTCGKEYEACRTPNRGVFRWRDIACSYECALKYIEKVENARKDANANKASEAQPSAQIDVFEPVVVDEDVVEEPVNRHEVDEDAYMPFSSGYQTELYVKPVKSNKSK